VIGQRWCFVVVCDVCEESSDCSGAMADQHFPGSEMARDEARLYGWSRDGGRDVCPDCTPIPYLPVAVVVAREVSCGG
jgi:hypothetical protein